MQLSSNAFSDGSAIPRRFTRDGEDLSPALDWQAAPAMTASFVLLCDDPDAPAGTWHLGRFTTLMLHKQDLPRAPATAVAPCDSSRRSTTSTGWATAVPARPAVMASPLSFSFAGPVGRPPIARHDALLPRGRARSTQACYRRSDPRRDLSAITFGNRSCEFATMLPDLGEPVRPA